MIAEHDPNDGEEEDNSFGENGDGVASSAIQIRALQADLSDKTRYIATLEKRLLQARRSSHSRVSMSFAAKASFDQEGGVEHIIREKDGEIAELRARLDDKERMISALRSSARKRDVADLTADTPLTSPSDRRSNSSNNSLPLGASAARVSGIVASPRASTTTPAVATSLGGAVKPPAVETPLSPKEKKDKKRKSVDEMTRLLDEMITERVHNGERIDSAYSVNGVNGQHTPKMGSVDSPKISSMRSPRTSSPKINSPTKPMSPFQATLRRTSVRISEPLPTATAS
jgi:centromeric protein E